MQNCSAEYSRPFWTNTRTHESTWVDPSVGAAAGVTLSPAQLAQVKEAFTIFDDDSSGSISVGELEIAMKSLGFTPAAMLREADADNNGELDLDEFVAMITAQASLDSGRGWLAGIGSGVQNGNLATRLPPPRLPPPRLPPDRLSETTENPISGPFEVEV